MGSAYLPGYSTVPSSISTVDGKLLYQYSLSLSRSTRTVAMQSSKILALSVGASNTYEQLTPQIYQSDCEAKGIVP